MPPGPVRPPPGREGIRPAAQLLVTGFLCPYTQLTSKINKVHVTITDKLGRMCRRIGGRLDDLELDYPSAKKQYAEISSAAKAHGWLPEEPTG